MNPEEISNCAMAPSANLNNTNATVLDESGSLCSKNLETDNTGAGVPPLSGSAPPPAEALPYVQMLQQTMQRFLQHLERREMGHGSTENAGSGSLSTPALIKPDARFRLADFDPDDSAHSIAEWLEDVTKIKDRLIIDESWMIVRCADALKGRARKFYNHWRPVERSWTNFVTDFTNAFPDGETHGTRMIRAANLKSGKFETLTDYALTKIRYLLRFLNTLPWDYILSCVETGLEDQGARDLVQARHPEDQQTLLRILGQYEAQKGLMDRPKHNRAMKHSAPTANAQDAKRGRWDKPLRSGSTTKFTGTCFACGKIGHRQRDCRNREATSKQGSSVMVNSQPKECTHCKKMGHVEDDCFSKRSGRPKMVQCVQPTRDPHRTPLATTLIEGKAAAFSYLIDTGADVSLMRKNCALRLHARISTNETQLAAVGATLKCQGQCTLFVALLQITAEITFLIVANNAIPGEADALIGLDVIQRKGLKLTTADGYVDLEYDATYVPRVAKVKVREDIKVEVSGLDEAAEQRLLALLNHNRDNTAEAITTGKMVIKLLDKTPVAYRPRHLAYAERVRVKSLVEGLIREGVVRESESEYASPIVLVTKKDGTLRMCVDYRDVNKRVAKDHYPLPRIQDQIDALHKYRYFTILDMRSGFHQMEIDEESKHITAFVTPDGHYEYNRMPFGYINASACYQRAIDKALGTLKGTIAYVYIDDVLCPAESIEEGFERLKLVLDALAVGGFSLNYKKCRFFVREIDYLGLSIGNGCVKPSKSKVDALSKTEPPKDRRGVRQFLGLAGYFRRFIQGFAVKTAPLTNLLRQDTVFEWNDAHESIRREIIRIITEQPVLVIFDPSVPVELHTDACALGIGGMLLQKFSKKMHPVGYYSRKTTDYEAKYHSYDLETLAIVESTRYFRAYLYGQHFTIFTDCNSVRATALKKDLHPRVARWWIKLQEFSFDIEYRPGHSMTHVDYLSRNPIINRVACRAVMDKPLLSIREYQADDPLCHQVVQGTLPGPEQHQYCVKDGLVYRRMAPNNMLRGYVPQSARLRVLKAYHDESAHIGVGKMIAKMQETIYWPHMRQSVKKYVSNCRACAIGKSHTGWRHGFYQMGEKPSKPFQVWHIDYAGPMVRSHGYTQILVVIDAFSKYCQLIPVVRRSAQDTIEALDKTFMELGHPKQIVADRGTAFTAQAFAQFMEACGIKLHLIATGVPRGNAIAERLMRTMFNLMRSTLTAEKESTWIDVIKRVEDSINNTISTVTQATPATLMWSKNEALPATTTLLQDLPEQNIDVPNVMERACQVSMDKHKMTISRLNHHRKRATPFCLGMQVLVEDSQAPSRGKLGARFKGPYTIKELLPNERYLLSRGGKRTTVAAREQLRVWPTDSQEK